MITGRPKKKFRFKNLGAQMLAKLATDNRVELGRKIGLSGPMLSHYEHGRRVPTLDKAILLEKKTGRPILAWKAKPNRRAMVPRQCE